MRLRTARKLFLSNAALLLAVWAFSAAFIPSWTHAHGEKISAKLPAGGFYEIPYRSLITDKISNLIVAGRCISASFILQASMRIQATCMSIGEAAGIAANFSLKNNIEPNMVEWDKISKNIRSYVSAG